MISMNYPAVRTSLAIKVFEEANIDERRDVDRFEVLLLQGDGLFEDLLVELLVQDYC